MLLDGDGHTWIALDYRGLPLDHDDPPVVWFDNELGQERRLAPDLATFLLGMRRA